MYTPPTKFCRRKLTGVELMSILDVPTNVQGQLNESEVKNLVKDIALIPLKCASIVLEGLLEVFELDIRDLNSKYNRSLSVIIPKTAFIRW